EGGFFSKSGQFKNSRREGDDGVDAGELVEKCDQERQRNRGSEREPGVRGVEARLAREPRRALDFLGFGIDAVVIVLRMNLAQDRQRRSAVLALDDQPTWALWDVEDREIGRAHV